MRGVCRWTKTNFDGDLDMLQINNLVAFHAPYSAAHRDAIDEKEGLLQFSHASMSDAGATHGSSRHEQVVQHESEVAPFRVYAKQGEGGREGGTDGTDGDHGADGGRGGVEGVIGAHFGEPLAERGFARGVDHRVEKVETSPITDMTVQNGGPAGEKECSRVLEDVWEEAVGRRSRSEQTGVL